MRLYKSSFSAAIIIDFISATCASYINTDYTANNAEFSSRDNHISNKSIAGNNKKGTSRRRGEDCFLHREHDTLLPLSIRLDERDRFEKSQLPDSSAIQDLSRPHIQEIPLWLTRYESISICSRVVYTRERNGVPITRSQRAWRLKNVFWYASALAPLVFYLFIDRTVYPARRPQSFCFRLSCLESWRSQRQIRARARSHPRLSRMRVLAAGGGTGRTGDEGTPPLYSSTCIYALEACGGCEGDSGPACAHFAHLADEGTERLRRTPH